MSVKIQEIAGTDFPALVKCMWHTYENPLQPLFHVWCPSNAIGCHNREESVEESINRFREWHASDPTSHWIKAVDSSSGDIVGGALWKLYERNPFEHEEAEEAYWQPEGGQRDFANQILQKYDEARSKMGRRGHVFLNIILTHPDHQRRGVGSQLLEWGIRKAADMDVEMWLNSWKFGRPLYEKHGFVVVDNYVYQPQTDKPDEAWEKFAKELAGSEEWVMWRPKDGPYVEGKSVKPWETQCAVCAERYARLD